MRRSGILVMAAIALGAAGIAQAQQRLPRECRQEIRQLYGSDRSQIRNCLREKHAELSENCAAELRARMQQQRRQDLGSDTARLPPQKFDLVSYGDHWRQGIDYHRPAAGNPRAALVLFIHGGAWVTGDRTRASHVKPDHFTAQNHAFASAGYRVLPGAPVEDQARDIAAAIAKLRADADELGFDRDRIVLIGHSAGAHLAALVATDPAYAGADMSAIRGVILLDGAGYDVPASMAQRQAESLARYLRAFGADPARQTALSPIAHVGSPDAANWLILHVADRDLSKAQSGALAAELRTAGAAAEALAIGDTDHGKLNRDLGKPGDTATIAVDRFLKDLFR